MAVDEQRDTFHANRVLPSEIGFLWSAQSYRPEVTRAIRRVKAFPCWRQLREIADNTIGPGPHPLYTAAGYPCLKTKNVDALLANPTPAGWADISHMSTTHPWRVRDGDILLNLTGAGSIGRASVYYGDGMPITNQHIARIQINGKHDGAYVCAFLRSWWGERVLEQGVAGSTGQLNMVNEHVRSIPIPLPHLQAQAYIGDKVREAERLRRRAKDLEREVDSVLSKVVPAFDHIPRRFGRTRVRQMGDRLDNQPYRTHFLSLVSTLEGLPHSVVGDLALLSGGAAVPSDLFGAAGVPLIRIRDIDPHRITQPETSVPASYCEENAGAMAREGDIVVGMDGEFRAQFFILEELPRLINQRVGIVRTNGEIRPELLSFWLSREEGQMQLNRWAVQTTVGHISLRDIAGVMVPRLGKEPEEDLADKLAESRTSQFRSQRMTSIAVRLVEALIEGGVREDELVAAKEALARGDDGPDRAIMERVGGPGGGGDVKKA